MKNIRKEQLSKLVLLSIPTVIYMFFGFFDGVVICVDTMTYIDMVLSREPFYPTFLAFNRMIFGTDNEFYLQMVVLEQSLLMAFAVYKLSYFLMKEFEKKIYVGVGVELICILSSLLCRFAAKRSSMYSNSIMTEGICISLFLLFSAYILDYLFNHRTKALVSASVCSLIMISSRKQMYITLVLLGIAIIYVELIEKKRWKKFILSLCLVLFFIVGCNKTFEYIYSYAIHGQPASHFNDNRFIATMIFFVAQEGDEKYIADPEIRELYKDIYHECVESGYTQQSAEGNINQVIDFFGLHYDNIQIDTMWPMIEEYAQKELGDSADSIARETLTDQTTHMIIKDLLPHTWTRIAYIFVGSCLNGYFNTVAKAHKILDIYSVAVGIVFLLMFFMIIRRDLQNRNNRELSKESKLTIYVLLALGLNIGVVAMVIFCQSRYMIYNMPLFYIAFCFMLMRICKEKKEKNND